MKILESPAITQAKKELEQFERQLISQLNRRMTPKEAFKQFIADPTREALIQNLIHLYKTQSNITWQVTKQEFEDISLED